MTDEKKDYVMLTLDEYEKMQSIVNTLRKENVYSRQWEEEYLKDKAFIRHIRKMLMDSRVSCGVERSKITNMAEAHVYSAVINFAEELIKDIDDYLEGRFDTWLQN